MFILLLLVVSTASTTIIITTSIVFYAATTLITLLTDKDGPPFELRILKLMDRTCILEGFFVGTLLQPLYELPSSDLRILACEAILGENEKMCGERCEMIDWKEKMRSPHCLPPLPAAS